MTTLTWDFVKLDDLRREKAFNEGRDIGWHEVAKESGVSTATIHRYRTNTVKEPYFVVVMDLSAYFGVKPSYFLAEGSDPIPAVVGITT